MSIHQFPLIADPNSENLQFTKDYLKSGTGNKYPPNKI